MAGTKRERELARLRAVRKQQAAEQRRRRRTTVAAGLVGIALVAALVVGVVVATGDDAEQPAPPAAASTERVPVDPQEPVAKGCETTSGLGALRTTYDDYDGTLEPGSTYTLDLRTNCGKIEITFDPDAPETTEAMTFLADRQYFDGSLCHRLTTEGIFVLQCGDPTGTGSGGPGFVVPDENLPEADESGTALYPRGVVAMANAGRGTVGSQFFLVHADTRLSPDYTVVGTITKGMAVLDRVADAGTVDGVPDGEPKQALEIQQAQSSATRKVTP